MQSPSNSIIIFLLVTTFLIVLMGVFVLIIVYLHRKKQLAYQEKINDMETNYEKNLLKTQLEIQEQTFQNISREIHDNINLSLTLAKLHLNTIDWKQESGIEKVNISVGLISSSIAELSDISKSLNADIIIHSGLLKALEKETERIRQTGLFTLDYQVTGSPVYMDNQEELIIFRIVQEGFNNIIKHAGAGNTSLILHYDKDKLTIIISDDGRGFDTSIKNTSQQAGLKNMETRIKILKGKMNIESFPGKGTVLSFTIPLINYG